MVAFEVCKRYVHGGVQGGVSGRTLWNTGPFMDDVLNAARLPVLVLFLCQRALVVELLKAKKHMSPPFLLASKVFSSSPTWQKEKLTQRQPLKTKYPGGHLSTQVFPCWRFLQATQLLALPGSLQLPRHWSWQH